MDVFHFPPSLTIVNVNHALFSSLLLKFEYTFLFFFSFFFEREGMSGVGAERDWRERIQSRLCIVRIDTDAGLKLTNREIVTRAEVRRLTS